MTAPDEAFMAGRVALVIRGGTGHATAIGAQLTAMGATSVVVDAPGPGFAAAGRLIDGVLAEHGQLDVLVSDASGHAGLDLLTVEEAEWEAAVTANLGSHVAMAQAAVPRMLDRGKGGRIVLLGGGAPFAGAHTTETARSAGLMGLTASMTYELFAASGIAINCVLSTPVESSHLVASVVGYLCTTAGGEVSGKYLYADRDAISVFSHPLLLSESTVTMRKLGTWDLDEVSSALPPLLLAEGRR
jgi:hypothetical protein